MSDNLERAIEKWKGQQSKYEQLFSPAVISSKGFKIERLRQLNVIASQYATEEKNSSLLRILKIERHLLEREVHVSFLNKWFIRFIDYFRVRQTEVQRKKKGLLNIDKLRSRMQNAGFGKYCDLVIKRIRETGKPFTLDHSIQLTLEQRMDYNMQFKPAEDGTIIFEGYSASLVNKTTKEERKQDHSFIGNDIVSASSAAVLLQGKAIQDEKQAGQLSRDWIQYDLNDKDAAGNFRIVRYDGTQYEQKVRDAIKDLPLKDGIDHDNKEELMIKLAQGKDVKVMLSSEKCDFLASILANPRMGDVIVLNMDGKVIDPYRMETKEQVVRSKQKTATVKPTVKTRKVAVS